MRYRTSAIASCLALCIVSTFASHCCHKIGTSRQALAFVSRWRMSLSLCATYTCSIFGFSHMLGWARDDIWFVWMYTPHCALWCWIIPTRGCHACHGICRVLTIYGWFQGWSHGWFFSLLVSYQKWSAYRLVVFIDFTVWCRFCTRCIGLLSLLSYLQLSLNPPQQMLGVRMLL
jgi:hypothetical protein